MKKILALILALTLVLALAACAGSNDPSTSDEPKSSDNVDSKDKILIGWSGMFLDEQQTRLMSGGQGFVDANSDKYDLYYVSADNSTEKQLSDVENLIAMGCKAETFAGLSGMGDLIVTCTSMHSRNLHAGMLIGRGKSVEEAKTEVGQVVEGINALPAACRLARQYKVEMPIVQAVEAILDGKLEARSALMALMGRSLKRE